MRGALIVLLRAIKWLGIMVAGLVLLLLSAWFVMPDEDLRDEVVQIRKGTPTTPPEQNVYYAMWGFKAAPTLDPHIVGRKILGIFDQAHAQHRQISEADYQKFLGTPQLKLDNTDKRFCKTEELQCLPLLRAARVRVESNERKLEPYIKRYRALRDYPNFEEILPDNPIVLLHYQDFTALSDLTDARIALDMTDKNKQKNALENLAAELKLWRKIGQNANSLITKMVATAVLYRKFRLTSELLAESPEISVQHPKLLMEITRPLSTNETHLDRALTGEFRWASNLFQDLAAQTEIFDGFPDGVDGILNKLFILGGYKTNATINLQYAKNKELREFYAQSASTVIEQEPAFLAEWGRFSPFSPGTLFYNPVGKILVYVAPPDYGSYVYRLHDLGAYSRLVELQRRIAAARLGADEIPTFVRTVDISLYDPYTDQPTHWDAQSQTLSVQGRGKSHNKLVVRVGSI